MNAKGPGGFDEAGGGIGPSRVMTYRSEKLPFSRPNRPISTRPAGCLMTNHTRCLCGYQAISDEDLSDHLAEVFTPDDDLAPDGVAHAELSRSRSDGTLWECLCGLAAVE